MGMVIRSIPKEDLKLKDLIPVYVDHNNKFFSVPGYLIHKDTGEIYSLKYGRNVTNKIKPLTKKNLIKLKPAPTYEDIIGSQYPRLQVFDPILFKDLRFKGKFISLHRTLLLSNILHFNLFAEYLHKALPHISLEELKNTSRPILEIVLRGLVINHIDHNKKNHHISNLELCTSQANTQKMVEHQKKVARKIK